MGLDDLQKKLYRPEEDFQGRPESPAAYDPGQEQKQQDQQQEQRQQQQQQQQQQEAQVDSPWQQEQISHEEKLTEKRKNFFASLFSFEGSQKKYFFIGSIALLVVIISLVAFVYWYGQSSFDKTWVNLQVAGPDRIVSGEEITYTVKYKNNTKVDLTEAQLIFYWPENSLPASGELVERKTLGNIQAGEEREIEFKGKVAGLKGIEKEIKTTLSYQPTKTRARFENVALFHTAIISVPLVLSFDMPEKVANGQQITVALKYLNDSGSPFEDLVVKTEYPEGFKVSSVYPQPTENLWQIGILDSKQEGKILITGTLEGVRGEDKTFRAYVGTVKEGNFVTYADVVKSAQISLPVITVQQVINDSYDYIANVGEYLNYKIKYQNNSHLGIPTVKITASLNTSALDFQTLELNNQASFDSVNNTITWDQTSIPELEFLDAGETGEMTFTVKVKDNLPIKNYSDKNFTIRTVVSSNSSNVPLALSNQQVSDTSDKTTKINTKIAVDAKGFYHDSLIPNSGPLPPKVGQTTTYTIYWQITNSSNDLEEVKVEAVLPANVAWVNNYNPSSAIFRYDNLSRKLTWEVGQVAAGTGALTPAKYVAFQIALTPSAPQIGQVVELLKNSKITGRDSFTSVNLENTDAPITSDLQDDPTVDWSKGSVTE